MKVLRLIGLVDRTTDSYRHLMEGDIMHTHNFYPLAGSHTRQMTGCQIPIVAIVGPSGSGKTTFLTTLGQLQEASRLG